ncbi:Flavoprotein [Cordyceps fumosorosea ARSEF 2679]|uniref:Flavoprotein n=1 Tax=Cordyceps fumosorosea (strain ARSEF 2679) TaxID=1081104 RepID=A0A162J7A3_CORFA|nr:Flavoprotein [Cordyceps fumosorosea ARSEF 2679]OAA64782.1 Flavoprotein [Cordyceps fumosorosea ARSEF 2679]
MEAEPAWPIQEPPLHSRCVLFDELAVPPKLRLLIVATGPRDTSWAHALIVRLSKNPDIEMRAIVDDVVPRMTQTIMAMQNMSFAVGRPDRQDDVEFFRHQAFDLVEWAHVLVCLPLDADGIAKMLAGISDTLIGDVLRSWNSQKSIVLVPGMSKPMWSSTTTKQHLNKLRQSGKLVQIMEPILWHYEKGSNTRRVPSWNSFHQVLHIIQSRATLMGLGRDISIITPSISMRFKEGAQCPQLPPEIWSLILEHANDWELAEALGIYTSLPIPPIWTLSPKDELVHLRVYDHELEKTALTGTSSEICKKLSQAPSEYSHLSALFIKMLFRFRHVAVLEYIESNRPELFVALEGTTIPTKVSSFFPSTKLLQYWKHSQWFADRHVYDAEAVDGASRYGHVEILDWWWRQSGMPLRYTETSLEQASANGHIAVLEWWQDAALQDDDVVLRPGRALLWAAQLGRADVLRWWHSSKIAVAYENDVVSTACQNGHVGVLEVWRMAKGDGKIYVDDVDVISATSYCHEAVLDWLYSFSNALLPGMNGCGRPIEFRVCDIQASLHRNSREQRKVRAWWAKHGIRPAATANERSRDIARL